ncbi:MAG: hypothetical protein IKT40_03635 [Bacilli bacterium]|nr:hypothetical protein [Bacilli bacterium]
MMNNDIVTTMMQILQMGQNPEQLIMNAAKNDPQINALINQKQQNNMSWKDLTLQIAQQKNVNIQPILQQLSQKGFRM